MSCPICACEITGAEYFMRYCGHGYHFACVAKWELVRTEDPACAVCSAPWGVWDVTEYRRLSRSMSHTVDADPGPIDFRRYDEILPAYRPPEGVVPRCCRELVAVTNNQFAECGMSTSVMRFIASKTVARIKKAWECLRCNRCIDCDDLARRSDACRVAGLGFHNCFTDPSHVQVHIIDYNTNACFHGCARYGNGQLTIADCPLSECNRWAFTPPELDGTIAPVASAIVTYGGSSAYDTDVRMLPESIRGGAVGDDGAIRGVAVENAVEDSATRGVAVENAVEDSAIRGVAVENAVEDGADTIDSDAATYQYQATFARMSEDPLLAEVSLLRRGCSYVGRPSEASLQPFRKIRRVRSAN